MNSQLYNKTIELPEEVSKYLQQCFDMFPNSDPSIEGHKRNEELRHSGYVTYQQLGRMKNWFDNFEGKENDLPYILNGGHYVKNWVNTTLTSMRDGNRLGKEIKSVVLPNQFNQEHQKDDLSSLNRPSKSHDSVLGHNLEITESLKRINQLIKKII